MKLCIHLAVATGLTAILLNGAVSAKELLTVGSIAPAFSAEAFVQGDSFGAFQPDTVYVVEFSGSQCLPCIRAIPHMEELQRKFPDTIFVAVFGGSPDDVKRFLDGPGRSMTGRVACDATGSMSKNWMDAAGRMGIPIVFVVDAVGKVAWIGRPDGLDKPLSEIVRGKHKYIESDPVTKMQLEIQKQLIERQRKKGQLEREAQNENRQRITKLIQDDITIGQFYAMLKRSRFEPVVIHFVPGGDGLPIAERPTKTVHIDTQHNQDGPRPADETEGNPAY